jgi:hypothetical protein
MTGWAGATAWYHDRVRALVVLIVLAWSPATRADDVNLLANAPSTVAVSSRVANAAILPEHLVDGKLATAWNSRTGDLVGAWIAVRVPADTHVRAIKLTAGFTLKDKRGDLFTMNPRIKKVRVSRGGKLIVEKTLDIENRGLQGVVLDVPGGDIEIRVLEIEPGSRKDWREACVSELEVWGTTPKPVPSSKPTVRVGGLDGPPALSKDDCIRAVVGPGKSAEPITSASALGLTDDVTICRIEHRATGSTTTTVEIAAVKRKPAPALIAKLTESTTTEHNPDASGKEGAVELVPFALTTTETALLVHVTDREYGPGSDGGTRTSTLYRVTAAAALAPVLQFQSSWSSGEASDSDSCELVAPTSLGASIPNLALACTKSEGRWHHEDARGDGTFTKDRKLRYRWTGARYEKQ